MGGTEGGKEGGEGGEGGGGSKVMVGEGGIARGKDGAREQGNETSREVS